MPEDHMHIGEDFQPPDSRAKVTGQAKYAEDILIDGMLHAKTVKSPYAHALVESIDTSEAEAMPGVEAVITYENLPSDDKETGYSSMAPPLDKEPRTYGQPVAAVAAQDEYTAAAAVEAVDVEYRVLDHVVDPIETLKPGSPNPRNDGNAVGEEGEIETIKWEDAEFAEGEFPENPGDMNFGWSYGDLDEGFDEADVVIEDYQVAHSVPQNPMEPRSNVAHYSNGKLRFWASSQSVGLPYFGIAGYLGLNPSDVEFIANYCGGGFGSKATEYPQMMVPALLSMQANQPVKIRGTRKEEFFWGNGRTTLHFKFRIGFRDDGRITAFDMKMIGDAGAYTPDVMNGLGAAATTVSSMYDPENMRAEGVGLYTNTPKRWAHRGPGENQLATALSPTLDKAAEELGMDKLDLRLVNAPDHRDPVGPERTPNTSCYLGEALEMAADEFGYEDRTEGTSEVDGSTIRGVGVGSADHSTGYVGVDGLVVIRQDGIVEFRTGVGNLGTYSFSGTARAGAETLQVPWDQVEVKWGTSDDNSFTMGQFGSNTMFTTSYTMHKAAQTAVDYLQEIAAEELGGTPDDYVVEGGEVYQEEDPDEGLTFAEAAAAAADLGGKYSGEEIPLADDLNPMTIGAAQDSVGEALVAFGKTDQDDRDGTTRTYCAAAAEVEIDADTGKIAVTDLVGVSDAGRVVHPASVEAQVHGGMIQGLGYALTEEHNFDEDTGIPYNTDWYTNKTPSILDYGDIHGDAVDEPDLEGPHGVKGMGEPPYGAAPSAIRSAVYDALGTDIDPPMKPDKVLEAIENEVGQ